MKTEKEVIELINNVWKQIEEANVDKEGNLIILKTGQINALLTILGREKLIE